MMDLVDTKVAVHYKDGGVGDGGGSSKRITEGSLRTVDDVLVSTHALGCCVLTGVNRKIIFLIGPRIIRILDLAGLSLLYFG